MRVGLYQLVFVLLDNHCLVTRQILLIAAQIAQIYARKLKRILVERLIVVKRERRCLEQGIGL